MILQILRKNTTYKYDSIFLGKYNPCYASFAEFHAS